MFAPDAPGPRVVIGVVAFGDGARLRACLESLVAHESAAEFSIVCVVNPDARADTTLPDLPGGVRVLRPDLNLGWAGGLHLIRSQTSSEFLVWAQDDMVVGAGWLDALVSTADRYPSVGAVGSVEVDPTSQEPNGIAGGFALPSDSVGRWNETDVIRSGTYTAGEALDWVTSKGMLTRVAAWDDVHGPDPRLYPLNHVDKDYSTHLRAHGWGLVAAPDAHLVHARHASASMAFRSFLEGWQEPGFNARWAPVVQALGPGEARPVPHECATWTDQMADIERAVGREASRMLVPATRDAARHAAIRDARIIELERDVADAHRQYQRSVSWRITAPLRHVRRVLRRRG